MFNLGIDDLAEKPYMPQKKCFYEFVANVLHDNIGIPPWRLLEAKHHTANAHFGTLTQCMVSRPNRLFQD